MTQVSAIRREEWILLGVFEVDRDVAAVVPEVGAREDAAVVVAASRSLLCPPWPRNCRPWKSFFRMKFTTPAMASEP